MHDDRSDAIIELIQGVPWRDPDSGEGIALGETATTEPPPQARLSLLGPPGSAGWEPEAPLRAGEIFPFAGGFMELVELQAGADGERARAVLRRVADAGGIVAPAPGTRVLVEGGRAKTDGRWLALTGAGPDGATFEHWRADRARSRLDDADIVRAGLPVDGVLDVDGVRYRLLRLQPQAGQLRAFVELARD